MSILDKAEYVRALTAEREALAAQLLDLESRLDEIDSEIARNSPPPDVSKMTELERVAYEDSQRLVAAFAAQPPSFWEGIFKGKKFPKGCKK